MEVIMNKIEKHRLLLIILGFIALIASIAFLIVGIIMLVGSLSGDIVNGLLLGFGIVFVLLFAPLVVLGIYFVWVGFATGTSVNVVEGNIAMNKATKPLCKNCGYQIGEERVCPRCGTRIGEEKAQAVDEANN